MVKSRHEYSPTTSEVGWCIVRRRTVMNNANAVSSPVGDSRSKTVVDVKIEPRILDRNL